MLSDEATAEPAAGARPDADVVRLRVQQVFAPAVDVGQDEPVLRRARLDDADDDADVVVFVGGGGGGGGSCRRGGGHVVDLVLVVVLDGGVQSRSHADAAPRRSLGRAAEADRPVVGRLQRRRLRLHVQPHRLGFIAAQAQPGPDQGLANIAPFHGTHQIYR